MDWPNWYLVPDGKDGKEKIKELALKNLSQTAGTECAVCEESDLFRCFSQLLDSEKDFVLELGSCHGVATKEFIKALKPQNSDNSPRVYGVDISLECVEHCKSDPFLSSNAVFEKLDVLIQWKELEEKTKTYVSRSNVKEPSLVVALDIGGNRELETLVATIPFVLRTFQPRLLLIKSQALYKAGQEFGLDIQGWERLKESSIRAIRDRRRSPTGQELGKPSGTKKKWNPRSAPPRANPETGVLICRFHNYDAKRGCMRYLDVNGYGSKCEYDHEYCHLCIRKGHRAYECNSEDREESLVDLLLQSTSAN